MPIQDFMTTLILLGMDFTDLKQYSSSKWFQLSLRSLVDGNFSRFIFFFHHKFSIGFKSRLFTGHVINFPHLAMSLIFYIWPNPTANSACDYKEINNSIFRCVILFEKEERFIRMSFQSLDMFYKRVLKSI